MREWGGRRGRREGGRKERRQAVYFILLDTDGPRGTSAWRSKTVKRTSIRHAWWMTGLSHVLERWGIKLASRHPISTSRAPSRACVRLGGTCIELSECVTNGQNQARVKDVRSETCREQFLEPGGLLDVDAAVRVYDRGWWQNRGCRRCGVSGMGWDGLS